MFEIPEGLSAIDMYVYLDKVEKKAKEMKAMYYSEVVSKAAGVKDGFETGYGKVSHSFTTKKSAMDSLKVELSKLDMLDICKKDDIDLKKVEKLIKDGVLPEHIKEHISYNKSDVIKVK